MQTGPKEIYKVWMHLERITFDDFGGEEEYESMDDEFLPLPIAVFDTAKEAIDFAEYMNDKHYEPTAINLEKSIS